MRGTKRWCRNTVQTTCGAKEIQQKNPSSSQKSKLRTQAKCMEINSGWYNRHMPHLMTMTAKHRFKQTKKQKQRWNKIKKHTHTRTHTERSACTLANSTVQYLIGHTIEEGGALLQRLRRHRRRHVDFVVWCRCVGDFVFGVAFDFYEKENTYKVHANCRVHKQLSVRSRR